MSSKAWRQERDTPSLSEVFRTIAVGGGMTPFRRFLSFVGPGYLVAVGYMDPGNWATSLAGGAAFGYTLLFVALLLVRTRTEIRRRRTAALLAREVRG